MTDRPTPRTEAGKRLLEYFEASEDGYARMTSGRLSSAWATAKVHELLPAIEAEAASRSSLTVEPLMAAALALKAWHDAEGHREPCGICDALAELAAPQSHRPVEDHTK